MAIRVKICGLTRADHVHAAVDAGAAYVGLNFFPRSPRYVTIDQARDLALEIPPGVAKVGLVVDAPDETLQAILDRVPLDILQLHGHEDPERVIRIRQNFGLPVMKVVGVGSEADLPALDDFQTVADLVMVDARPPAGAKLPGGNGIAFDWRLIAGRRWSRPWLLAGGLTSDNVAAAIAQTGARQVDVSSGVESAPGVKDPDRIRAFIEAAQTV